MPRTRVPARDFGEGEVLEFVLRRLEGCSSVLDAGCNTGKYLLRIKNARPDIETWALDAHEPALAQVTASHKVLGEMPKALYERVSQVDAIVCLDVIEHLDKKAALDTLFWFDRLALKRVVLFTPHGYQPQETDDPKNPWMSHRSGWTSAELEALGYEVTVWDGFHGQAKCPDALWAVRETR